MVSPDPPKASINAVLKQLIALTAERDTHSLEISLAHTLFELAAPGAVVIYRVEDVASRTFSATLLEGRASEGGLPDALRNTLSVCVESGSPQLYQQAGHEPVILHPLRGARNQPMAVIAIVSPESPVASTEMVDMLLRIYQNFLSLINDNERDTLTGLLNRKTFEQKVSKIIARVQNGQRKHDAEGLRYFLAIFDIDHFKRVNDQFGHLVGDEVLLLFAQQMMQGLRDKDLLFRFGGEEFVVIFECGSSEEMQSILDRFREAVANSPFPQVGHITVSAGYTEIFALDISSRLIDRADMALYYAKNHGRNCAHSYETLVACGQLEEKTNEGDIELF